jgi:uroporphyrinogen-III synthase
MAHPQPLSGRRVVVTRTREQASALSAKLAGLGAEVIELPVLRITQKISKDLLAEVLLELATYDWLVFTSANGVRFFFGEFLRIYDDIRSLGLIRIACVGDGTARAVSDLHLRIECQPAAATAEALADQLVGTGSLDHAKLLVITGNLNRDTLVKKLEEARAIVDCLQVYQTEKTDLTGHPAAADFRKRGADAVLFASSSSAQSFVDQGFELTPAGAGKRALTGSIGPQTSATLKKCGLKVDFEASIPGIDELVEALVKRLE